LYYATEGKTDPVVVSLPKGGYVPRFEENSPAAPGAPASAGAERRRRALLTLAAILASAAVAALLWPSAPATRRSAEIRFEVATPATTDPISLALSPDGEKLVFVASDGAQARLWLRPFNVTLPRALAGTEHASLPFWSADNKSLGFFADSLIKRIDIESGRVEELAGAAVPGGAAWNQQGVIVYAGTIDSALRSISSEGKNLAATTELAPGQTGHRSPHFLPDGRRFLYYAMGRPDVRGIYVGDLDSKLTRRLFDADTPAVYSAGHLLYVHQGTLLARSFDPVQLRLLGDPTPVAEHVASGTRAEIAAISASGSGPVAYRGGSPGGKRQFVWYDRKGRQVATMGRPHSFGPSYASMSPDGRRLAVQRTDRGNTDIWLIELGRDSPIRFTTAPEADIAPLWSPAGDRLVFSSRQSHFNLFERLLGDDTAAQLLATNEAKSATDWSRDGRFLLFRSLGSGSNWDIWAMPMRADRRPFAVVHTKFDERDAQFSPDGKWIAYQSDSAGTFEIYIQPFPAGREPVRISPSGGVQVRWRSDGRELFYLGLDGRLMAVPVAFPEVAGQPQVGAPASLFMAPVGSLRDIALHHYIVSRDGERFLFDAIVDETPSPIVVILNWAPPQ
jgi:Tol biopolymer transport system component